MLVDCDKLKIKLDEIEKNKPKEKMIDPLRGLTGELNRKMLAGLAGHRSGKLTIEEEEEIKRIQLEYDLKK